MEPTAGNSVVSPVTGPIAATVNTPIAPKPERIYYTQRIQDLMDKIQAAVGQPIRLKFRPESKTLMNPFTYPDTYGESFRLCSKPGDYFFIVSPEAVTMKNPSQEAFAHFRVVEFPGCCGMLIGTGVWVKHKRKGVGTLIHQLMEEIARLMKYTFLVVTDITANEPESRIWKKQNFKTIHQFTSVRTHNHLSLAIKRVAQEPGALD